MSGADTNWFEDTTTTGTGTGGPGTQKLKGEFHEVPLNLSVENVVKSTVTKHIVQQAAGTFFNSTTEKATGYFNLYANVDLIRPYYNIEPFEVGKRLCFSLVPQREVFHKPLDLYGPTVLVFTLIAILVLGMKLTSKTVQEGTLLGTSFALCATYWIFSSVAFALVSYLLSLGIKILDYLSVMGYALFGVCISLLSHCFFAGSWIDNLILLIFGGLSSLRIGFGFFCVASNSRQGTIVGLIASSVHFLFIVYLQLYYATFYGAVAGL
eukprot:TRINITY_DN220_c0_g2_i1.p2 TRINITY_DN220_c0_g2~~TRINITY_DN220_c0_g2_i1.p2  ORF type:complete len:267 (+),score=96.72 TRINITY_DN220_c0_g2_i1:4144-4944(+)